MTELLKQAIFAIEVNLVILAIIASTLTYYLFNRWLVYKTVLKNGYPTWDSAITPDGKQIDYYNSPFSDMDDADL